MYLVAVLVQMDLDGSLHANDREGILRILCLRCRAQLGTRAVVRTDGDDSIAASFFEEKFDRVRARADDFVRRIESAGEARVLNHAVQTFGLHEGRFREAPRGQFFGADPALSSNFTKIYSDDDPEIEFRPGSGRRKLRIPVRGST